MSPAKASSARLRSWARKSTGLCMVIDLPLRGWKSFMPRSKRPEQSRMKASRSRWRGSMFAWILNTKPVTASSLGSISRSAVFCGRGDGAFSDQRVEQAHHPEIVERAAEIDRGEVAFEVGLAVEGRAQLPRHVHLFAQLGRFGRRQQAVDLGIVEPFANLALGGDVAFGAVEQDQPIVQEVVAAAELGAHADRPGARRHVQLEVALDLVHQLERLAAVAVELVDEGDDRHVAHPAHFEKLAGLRFDAFGGVEHHHRRVDRGQGAVGVLGEVFVAGGVEQVEGAAAVVEGHHRDGDRDAALALDFHPVGAGAPAFAAGLDLAGELDGAAEEQQLFGEGGLAGVGVRDDREGAPLGDFVGDSGHG